MTGFDRALRDRLVRAWRSNEGKQQPSFEATWQQAVDRQVAGRRHYRRFASVAAVAAALVIAMNLLSPTSDPYIEVADLLETTYWSAPSDVLLPSREFDIYQDMPVLFESTEPAGGTLL